MKSASWWRHTDVLRFRPASTSHLNAEGRREGRDARKGAVNMTSKGPNRRTPSQAPADAIERVSPRLMVDRGDIVLMRERLPRVNPKPMSTEPQWRYRVCVEAERGSSEFFTGFAPAAARAQELATQRFARLLLVEDSVVSLLANYRPR